MFFVSRGCNCQLVAFAVALQLIVSYFQAKAIHDTLGNRVHFVHVGKAGGGTVRSAMSLLCQCIPMQVHMRPVHSNETHTSLIVSVRDPVERVLSSFNWRHPTRGGLVRCPAYSSCADPRENNLYTCFDNVNDFAESLDRSNFCGYVARRALTDGVGHVGKGVKYYFEEILPLLPNMMFTLVNTDSFYKDLRCALLWLGFPAEAVDALKFDDKHSTYPSNNETTLSSKGHRNLESFLIDEYFIYHELYKYADTSCSSYE